MRRWPSGWSDLSGGNGELGAHAARALLQRCYLAMSFDICERLTRLREPEYVDDEAASLLAALEAESEAESEADAQE